MAGATSQGHSGHATTRYGLSERAAHNSVQDLPWDIIEKLMENLWAPSNPDGLVFLGVAENPLLQQEVATYITNKFRITPADHLGYGAGPRGSPRLRKALASFLGLKFRAREPVLQKEVIVLPGVVAVLDALTWSVCNEGEGIIVPTPFYTGFTPSAGVRAKGVLIPAPFQSIQGYRGLDDVFEAGMNKRALEGAFQRATRDGVKVRAVMLSNPHNPLGRCYPAETLREIARFCGRNNLHLISDEVYARSVYDNPRAAEPVPFTSVLELDLSSCIDRSFVHVAYGASKDFGATGLRLGVLHSRNEGLVAAVSSICVLGWVPYAVQEMWANMLEDEAFLADLATRSAGVLADHCSILVAFLEQHGIPYYTGVNAGVFIWVDLRRYLCGRYPTDGALDLRLARLSPSDAAMYRDREARLARRCVEGGVLISLGSSFSTEELGWFRISFTVERQALEIGLKRLLKLLKAIEAEGWELP